MSDFRQQSYDRYLSTFKATEDAAGDGTRNWAYYKYKYMRLLGDGGDIPRDVPVLDVGCGTGQIIQFLQKQGFTAVEGVDLSGESVAKARSHGLKVEEGDALAFLEAHPDSFGLIVALNFVEHFTRDELSRLFPAMFRALRKGGHVLIQTPNGSGLFPGQIMFDDLTHMTIFTPVSLDQSLRLAGFGDIRFTDTGPAPISWKGRIRLVLWKLICAVANLIRYVEATKTQAIWTENLICCCTKAE